MAWEVLLNGTSRYFQVADVTIPASTEFDITVLVSANGSWARPFGNSSGNVSRLLIDDNTNDVRLTDSVGLTRFFDAPVFGDTDLHEYRFVRNPDNTVDFYFDAAYVETSLAMSGTFIINQLGKHSSGAEGTGSISLVSITVGGAPLRNWDASVSDHSGSTDQPILTDTIGGNNATGVGFPSFDASVWVDLGGGGGESIIVDSGSYSVAGTDVGLLVDRVTSNDSGSYSLSGNSVGVTSQLLITSDTGVYTLTGNDAEILHARKVILNTGSYTLTGNDVTLTLSTSSGESVTLDAGVYLFTGSTIPLTVDYRVIANTESYNVTGTSQNLNKDWLLTANNGDYSLIGSDLGFKADYVIIPSSIGYSLTGNSVSLIYSGEDIQVIGNVTVGYATDRYTTSYKLNNITVGFK